MTNFVLMDDAGGPSVPFSLPTGTVTFLLTDIEASTAGWEFDAAAMGPAVERHYELIHEAVVRWGGVRPVEQGEGDSTVAAFSRASDAVAAAIDAQRVLTEELGGRFRVRMALHTGEAQLRDEGNYFGQAVIRCARLRSCGHGGQILLSNTTAELVVDRLPDGAELVDLGAHRLKDLARTEQVFELDHEELPDAGQFPALNSLDAFAHNLPAQMTPLVGREQEMKDVVDLVRTERLVTLTGTGGAGKTRLAAEVGARLVGDFVGGVWWCELAPRRDEEAVAALLAEALRVTESAGRPLFEQVAERLSANGPTLVILDNAEHLISEVARSAADLLAAVRHLRLLATSREPLSVVGELAWRVPSLAVPPSDTPPNVERLEEYAAVNLFVDRAARSRPGFVLDDANAAAVARICQRLDGIPLAIELAAARTRSLAPDRIATQLDDRFRLLTGGPRTLLPRQQTLLASVAWSEELLDAAERVALHRLGVFVGGFTLEAAEAVLGAFDDTDPYEVLDLVGRLVDKSLVVHDEESGRYRLLETIRTFAVSRLLDDGEVDAARDTHLAWATRCAEAFSQVSETSIEAKIETFGSLAPEWSNFVAALDWCADRPEERMQLVAGLGQFWLLGQRITDAIEYGLASIERFGADPPPSWFRAVGRTTHVLGNAAVDTENYATIRSKARTLAVEAGDHHVVLRIDVSFAIQKGRLTGLTDEFLDEMADILEESRRLDDADLRWNAALVPFTWLTVAGRVTEAAAWSETLPVVPRTQLIKAWMAMAVGQLADAAAFVGDSIDLAREHRMEADLHYAESAADVLEWISGGESVVARPRRALPPSTAPAHDSHSVLQGLARVRRAVLENDHDEIRRMAQISIGDDLICVRLAVLVAAALVQTGDLDEVRRRATQLVERGRSLRSPAVEVEARLVLADVDRSVDDAYEALALAARYELVLFQIDALELIAVSVDRDGQHERSGVLKASALAARDRIGYRARWASREEAFAAITVNGATPPMPLDEATALALRGRGERKRPTIGWDALTPTELEVAALVATGLTNPAVAERLHVERSTVKTHLDHIYAKLSISSRSELAAEVARRERD